MPKTNMKKYAFSVTPKNEAGFTMISSLLMITIIILTLPFLAHVIHLIHTSSNYNQLSVQHFLLFLRDDMIGADNIQVADGKFHLTLRNGDTASIEQYKEIIRRRVDEKGHEIYLRNVEDFVISPNSKWITVIITSEGVGHEKIISRYE